MSKPTSTTKLSKVADVIQGQSPKSEHYSEFEGVPFLQGNRTFGNLYPHFDTYTKKVTKLAKRGAVLMSVRAPVGALNFAPCDLCIGRGLASIQAKNGDNHFIYYALKYNVNNLIKQGGATTFDSVNKDLINDFELVIPSEDSERRKVSAILFALDAKIELNNRINAELEKMAKTLYDYWFVQFDFPDQNGKPYKSSGGKMVWSEELKREIPEGWEVKSLGGICDIYQPQTISEKEMSDDGKYYVFGANGVVGKYDKYNHESSEIVVTCRGNTCGNIVRTYPLSWITGNAMIVKSKDKNLNNEFIFCLLQNINIHKVITGSAQPQITRTNLSPVRILMPTQNLLEDFSEQVESNVKKRLQVIKENQKLAEIRDFLLPMLMNGQVRVE